MKISLLINMKMPTVVGIFIFISRENFMLDGVEAELNMKKVYNLGARVCYSFAALVITVEYNKDLWEP